MVKGRKGKGKDTSKRNGDIATDTSEPDNSIRTATAKVSSFKPGIECIAGICFTEEGLVVKIPKDADPKCAFLTTETILGGKEVKFEIEKSEGETKTEEEQRKDKEALVNNLRQTLKDLEEEVEADKEKGVKR